MNESELQGDDVPTPAGGLVTPLDQIRWYLSANELFGTQPKDELFRREVAQLPTDWLVRASSFLNWLLEHPESLDYDIQDYAVSTFAPGSVKAVLMRQRDRRKDLFIYGDQLLGLVRAAVLYGAEDEPNGAITSSQMSAFFWALLRYGDLHSRELGTPVDAETAAKMALRGLGVGQNAPTGNILARAHALWLELPNRPEIAASPHAINIAEAFSHATNGCSLGEYLAVAMAVAAHARDIGTRPLQEALPLWPMDAAKRFASSTRAERLVSCLDAISADRDALRTTFTRKMPAEPQYLGVAMLPFRDRPVYRIRSGQYLLLSEDLLFDGAYDLAYWRVADHLKEAHGENAFLKFTQFYAQIFERYVAELVRSAYDLDEKRVYVEAEARPPKGAPDVAIFLPDRVLMIEVTKTQLRYVETVLAGDIASFDADLVRTAKKAAQLKAAADAFKKGEIAYEGHDSAADRALPIERVVVLSQAIPRFPLLWDRMREALAGVGVEPDAWIISIAELEALLHRNDIARPSRLLREWTDHPTLADTSLHNFIYYTQQRVVPTDRPKYIVDNAEALRQRIKSELALKPYA